jgi:hypothetical protein
MPGESLAMPVGRIVIVGLFAFGLVAGLLIANVPALADLPVPSLVWPLILALAVDLALMPFVQAGRVEPLTMNERTIGVIGSALIITIVVAALS